MLNSLPIETIEEATEKVTDSHPEETRRMKKWLAENIAAGKSSKLGHYVRVTLTPVLAQLLLDKNSSNRPITENHVHKLHSDIDGGLWRFNSQPIIVSGSGELLDGQHRCSAVVSSGKTIDTLMSFGADDESRFTMDTGRVKTAGNFLAMNGKGYSNQTATAIGYYLQYLNVGYIGRGGQRQYTPTKAEIVAASNNLRAFDVSIEFTVRNKSPLRSHSLLATAHYIFKRKAGADAANDFIRCVLDGDGVSRGNPIYACREKLLRMTDRTFYPNDKLEILIKCWNAWRDGRRLESVKVTGGKLPKVEA
jgi:hypothetical protein